MITAQQVREEAELAKRTRNFAISYGEQAMQIAQRGGSALSVPLEGPMQNSGFAEKVCSHLQQAGFGVQVIKRDLIITWGKEGTDES